MEKTQNLRLEGRNVLITGAGRGIGQVIATQCAQDGANIIIAEIDLEGAEETAALVETFGRESLVLKVDVSKSDEVQAMVTKAYEIFDRVDVLVNNAGIFPNVNPLIKVKEAIFDRCVAINLRGTFLCSKYMG